MTINRSKGNHSSKSMTMVVWNICVCIGIRKLLQESKIGDVNQVCMLASAYDNIAGFEVVVNEVARMDILQAMELTNSNLVQVKALKTLLTKEKDSFHREPKIAFNKKFIKQWAKAFNHYHIKASFCTKTMGTRDTNAFAKIHRP